jgi:transcriptional regulator with XRE-family HTH domain
MTTGLKFRNIIGSPDDPVEAWPFEGILAAVERGTLPDWRRLAKSIRADPWGPVARQVLEAVQLSRPYGTAELLEAVVAGARTRAAESERIEVSAEVRRLVEESALSQQSFADRIGTSRSRLSTYMSGKVVPSASLMVRMRRVASRARESTDRDGNALDWEASAQPWLDDVQVVQNQVPLGASQLSCRDRLSAGARLRAR